MMNHRPIRIWLALCLFCLLVVTGCASSLTPNPKAGDISAAVPLNVGFSRNPSYLPWLVAKEEDLFKSLHQNIDAKWFEDYGTSVEALASGLLDLNSQSASDTIYSVAEGADLSIVLAIDRSMGNEKIIASDAIQTTADLKGKKIALAEGVAHHLLLLLGLQKAKLTLNDVVIQTLDSEAATEAFTTGKVDVIGISAPYTTFALARNGSRELWSSVNFPGLFFNTLSVDRQTLDRYPEKIEGAIEAWSRTLKYMQEHRDRAYEIMSDRADVSIETFKSYDSALKRLNLEENAIDFRSKNTLDSFSLALETISQLLLESGTIETKPEVAQLLDRRFVDTHIEINSATKKPKKIERIRTFKVRPS
ncbi:aliphatic sulfonate ABC transporter substrate-binding protein [Oscillatoriales cyanobacterium LEGE 11467]|uniref:Aliphatic sulfonate ABC transporter substrate-binding protein n=1 Tax=Zarconia navalis LEGE 11467 TaxID=1828826 RepID=A0A928Z878_9CYAN|nr:aliphatic sulfonate ABC transporter substrate-binding protein [Zarconia navalis]MBE9039551.1 aliphatic sulfonate ABC transporter substrate-binding protein [Zarconia navalis LEGE 11467]